MNTTRNKLLKLNTFTSLFNQIITIICGFILPKLILETYGSEVNGLVNSITQFLHVIAFLEMGVGAVVQSALYKPLADKNTNSISKIIVSAQNFFNKLAFILIIYVVILMVIYPLFTKKNFGFFYTSFLIFSISISSIAQYYFGIVNSLLLRSDQHGFIQYAAQIISVVLNTFACVILIRLGAGIHIVKLTTSFFYLLRPIALHLYVSKNYNINRKIKINEEPIKQKWNGIAQHISAVVLDGTDNIVLTIFSTLSNVSIYSVYYLVISGIKNMFLSLTNGIQSLIGELWAKQELQTLNTTFGWFEWLLHTGTVFVFGCVCVLISPFISIYTAGVNDVNYVQPLFAYLITIAHAGHCIRLPYNIMILAGGHYKQTQSNYIIASALNIIISIIAVVSHGLVGVAIGTLIAMIYQTIWMAYYISKNLIKWPFKNFIKQMLIDIITISIIILLSYHLSLNSITYMSWIIMAVKVVIIALTVIFIVNFIFYRKKVLGLYSKITKRRHS